MLLEEGRITIGLTAFYDQVEKLKELEQTETTAADLLPSSRTSIVANPAPARQQAADTTIPQFHHDPVSGPLVLTPAGEDVDQREQDDNAS